MCVVNSYCITHTHTHTHTHWCCQQPLLRASCTQTQHTQYAMRYLIELVRYFIIQAVTSIWEHSQAAADVLVQHKPVLWTHKLVFFADTDENRKPELLEEREAVPCNRVRHHSAQMRQKSANSG